MEKSSKVFVDMDVQLESIDIALAKQAGEVRHLGQFGGDRDSPSAAYPSRPGLT